MFCIIEKKKWEFNRKKDSLAREKIKMVYKCVKQENLKKKMVGIPFIVVNRKPLIDKG